MANYNELIQCTTFEERIRYLQIYAKPFDETFGCNRYLNQRFYMSDEWRSARRDTILRDFGCDLGVKGYEIEGTIIVHHIEPITKDDIINKKEKLLDLNNLICVSKETHRIIHYGNISDSEFRTVVERKPGDTKMW